jgi:hypothetical protein
VAQLELLELVLQLDFLSAGKVHALWKQLLLLQQLSEVPLLACTGLHLWVVRTALYLVLAVWMSETLPILIVLYSFASDILQFLQKRRWELEGARQDLVLSQMIISGLVDHQLWLMGRSHLLL